MGEQDAFERILSALYDAVLDDARWAGVSALIDEACGLTGNSVMVGEGPRDDIQVSFVGGYLRGKRREDWERDYLENYHSIDERVPRIRRLPDSHLVHVRELFAPAQLKASPLYNEFLRRTGQQDSLLVRLDAAEGSHITCALFDPVDSDGWGSSRVRMVTALLPHIRQFVRIRQALVRAEGRRATVTALLDNPRIGVIHLDRRGRILEVNDCAGISLRHGDGLLSSRGGMLRCRAPDDQVRLERLVGAALPAGSAAAAAGGSMLLRRSPVLPPFVVHVKPVGVPQPDYGARHVAAVLLVVEAGRQHPVDPAVVAAILALTPTEAQVAVWLAEGKSVRDMARATGQKESTFYWHLRQIYRKLSISGQVDLVRLVLSLGDFG